MDVANFQSVEQSLCNLQTAYKTLSESILPNWSSLPSAAQVEFLRNLQEVFRTSIELIRLLVRNEKHRPLNPAEAYELLGVAPGCAPEELASAYRQRILEWHPDKLDTMAQELRDYATRQTGRINEAYEKLKPSRV